MQEKEEADRRSPSISIGGDVNGPVTVGDGNIVVGSVEEGASAVVAGGDVSQIFTTQQRSILNQFGTQEQVITLEAGFQKLIQEIEEVAPGELQPEAKERAKRLISEVASENVDVPAIEKVKTWFVDNLPALLGTLTGILTHPIVGKLVEASSEYTLG